MTPTVLESPAARQAPAFEESKLVPPPRATRKLAWFVALGMAFLSIIFFVSPWRQNIPATGRVVAFDPLDRMQLIPAPVTGRLKKLFVQEGTRVKEGDPLVELSDLDPDYERRLTQQVEFSQQKVSAARDTVEFYTRQLELLEQERTQAIAVANADREVAQNKVHAEQQELLAAEADLKQKSADRTRRETLFPKKLVSELDLQKAVAASVTAEAKVRAVDAKLEQVKSELRAKEAKVRQVTSSTQAKIESVRTYREDARSKKASAEKELNDSETKLRRQHTQTVPAPRDGVVLRIHGGSQASFVKSGEPLIDFVPTSDMLAVELWVRGNDAPLMKKGHEVRLQFEGWPAVQFAGWPSVAVGTFGGRVHVVDAHDNGAGRFRVLVVPDPNDEPWPDLFYARQGTRANGWVLLDEVSVGYELWRQLNAFPPSLESGPNKDGIPGAKKEKKRGDADAK
ncbi:MAG: HlyD family efflux transporter periplasmic adaptor subunit [Planctomycetota bacterium]